MNKSEYERRCSAMEPWYWWGIPTFFRCPVNPDPQACDIGLVGVPHSSGNGSTERDQHLAPRVVRDISGRYRRPHEAFGFVPWDVARIHDLGDVPLPEAMNNDVSVGHIEEYFRWLDQSGTHPVSMGGDHAITGPILKAFGGQGTQLAEGRKLSLVQFDAHRDDYDHMPHWLGNRRSAAHWAAYTAEEGHVDPHSSIQIGIRGNQSRKNVDRTHSDYGYEVLLADTVHERGVSHAVDRMRERVGDNPVYVTFDLDALDPADAPGVSNLEAGYAGLRAYQAIDILHGLRGMNVVGADIVCMMPTMDNPNRITAMTGMVMMFELTSLIAERLGNK